MGLLSKLNGADTPVLFLDFDGPLHSMSASQGVGYMNAPPDHWDRLFHHNQLLEDILSPVPEIRIIVSSAWRLVHSAKTLVKVLGPLGHRFIGIVPYQYDWSAPTRAEEITRTVVALGLIDWIAIDDNQSFPLYSRSLILCDPELGLGCEIVQSRVKTWVSIIAKKVV